jgi:hypothetical protein
MLLYAAALVAPSFNNPEHLLLVELYDALVFLLPFHQAQASQHVADRHMRVIRPKHPTVLVLITTVGYIIAVEFLETFPVLRGRTPD